VFNLSGSEIVVILLLALVILGPEKLPDAIRKFGKTYAEFKKTASGFQSEFRSALDEPMREMRQTADLIRKSADFSESDPEGTKPVTQQMAPANPDAPTRNTELRASDDPPHGEPTHDLPFGSGDSDGGGSDTGDSGGGGSDGGGSDTGESVAVETDAPGADTTNDATERTGDGPDEATTA
jgi:sec-independent protein translocase protein TatB